MKRSNMELITTLTAKSSARYHKLIIRYSLASFFLISASASQSEELPVGSKTPDSIGARNSSVRLNEVVVHGEKPPAILRKLPAVAEGITAKKAAKTINVVNTGDALKYLPSLQLRRHHPGDTGHGQLGSRTSGPSHVVERSLVYADGLLLSNLLGGRGGPATRWEMVSPEEMERIDVIYGPFSAAFPGNSIGATVLITTRLPEKFEAHARAQVFRQNFKLFGSDDNHDSYQTSALLGNRHGGLAWFASFNHLDAKGNPMSFPARPLSTTAALPGDPVVTGAFPDTDALGAPRVVLGASGISHTVQDNLKLKLAYDFTPVLRATYTLGYWQNNVDSTVQSYLRDTAGNPVFSGANLNIGGHRYTLPANLLRPSQRNDEHWMHGLSLKTPNNIKGKGEWEAVASWYDYGKDESRFPTTSLPLAASGGQGQIALRDGTGWHTLDLKGGWRPGQRGRQSAHEVSFGYHYDRYTIDSRVFDTNNWLSGSPTTRFSAFAGNTETQALFAQDAWTFQPDWKLILGGRLEQWRSFDGATSDAVTTVTHAARRENFFSPKVALALQATPDWLLRASLGRAYRMPTAGEVFQGEINLAEHDLLRANDPNLKPEQAQSGELTAERGLGNGLLRLSLFHENIYDAIYRQTNVAVFPVVTNIQNIDHVRTRGIEAAFQGENVGLRGLDLSGSVTYADSEIRKNTKVPGSVGKAMPRVPDWRATAVATYHQNDRLSYTLAARYSGQQYSQVDNSDINPNAVGGTSRFFVADVRVNYPLNKQLTASVGVDNLNNERYYDGHPYAQRTFHAELKASF